jgi:uncharacterized YigZ family protein
MKPNAEPKPTVPVVDTYLTLAQAATGDFRDRGSKFLAYAYPVENEKEALAWVEQLRREHHKANHHCFAYRLGTDKHNFRASDDGEPSGTAGRPILGQIDSFGLTNALVVVVRYFGGTLLGTSGLIQAYRASAQEALQQAEKVEKILEARFRIHFSYPLMSSVMNAVKRLHLPVMKQEFHLDGTIETAIRLSLIEETLLKLKAAIAGVSEEEAATLPDLEDCDITQI